MTDLPPFTKEISLSFNHWDIVLQSLLTELTSTRQKHSKVNRDLVRKDELQQRVYALKAIIRKIEEETLR